MKKVLVVGKNSFLAKAFIALHSGRFSITGISHGEFSQQLDLDSYDRVLNMAYSPEYFKSGYCAEKDFDLRVALSLKGRLPHFFMMSTRKVYGSAPDFPVAEEGPIAAKDFYGGNKAITEAGVNSTLGSKCTVLRIANIFGPELGRHTFFGIALSSLKRENRIVLDVSPFTLRDFLPVETFAEMLGDAVDICPSGTFNMGSGKATPIGQIALWLIEGFGRGELVVNQTGERDAFLLDSAKLNRALGYGRDKAVDVRRSCLEIGRRLRDA